MTEVQTVRIAREPIELYQLLKLLDLAASGGEAKHAIAEGLVRVNGEVETRKRKKIGRDDLVEFAGRRVRIVPVDQDGGGEKNAAP